MCIGQLQRGITLDRVAQFNPADLFRYAGPLQWGLSLVVVSGVLLIVWLLRRRSLRRH